MASLERRERATRNSERVYRGLLRAYPRGLRDEYGGEMVRCFRDLCREELEDGGGGLAALWARTLAELLYTSLKERSTILARNTYRSVVGVALATALVLLVPLLTGWPWGLADFVIAGSLIFGTGLAVVLVASGAGDVAYKAAVGVALAAAFLLVWVNLAVGIIGTEDNPANLMYVGVLAVGLVGAMISRFRSPGMARALFAMALAQALVAVIAVIAGFGSQWSGLAQIVGVTGLFVALFAGSALLFRYAGRRISPADMTPEG